MSCCVADPWGYARNGGRADLLLDGWSNDYPDAQNSFTDLLDPRDGFHFYPAWFKDARWLGRMRAAAAAPEATRRPPTASLTASWRAARCRRRG